MCVCSKKYLCPQLEVEGIYHFQSRFPLAFTWHFLCARYPLNGLWAYKTFFMLNSAEHEIFSANKYENANNSFY